MKTERIPTAKLLCGQKLSLELTLNMMTQLSGSVTMKSGLQVADEAFVLFV